MSRIAPEDMTTLITEASANTIASTALAELEEMSVAYAINSAANCGEYTTTYAKPISDTLRTKLEGLGYVITSPAPLARDGEVSIISWKTSK